jgi:hypothetical protein
MLGDAKLVQRPPADKFRIGFDLRLRDLHDLLGDKLGQLIGAAAGEFQFPASAFVGFHHDADLVGIKCRVFKQPIDRHSTPPRSPQHTPRFRGAGGEYDCLPSTGLAPEIVLTGGNGDGGSGQGSCPTLEGRPRP